MSMSKPAVGTKSTTTAALAAPSKNTDTIDTYERNPRAQTTGSAKDDQSVMGNTLMARVANMNRTMPSLNTPAGGKKDMNQTGQSSVNLASKATATSMNNTQNKTVMSQSNIGARSPFRDSTQKGIVSGMGLLTF